MSQVDKGKGREDKSSDSPLPEAYPLIGTASLANVDNVPDSIEAENLPLCLPSALPGLIVSQRLRSMELRLRLAEAEDMLEKIRGYRRNLYSVGVMRKVHIAGTGTRPNTRVQAVFDRLQSKIRVAAETYRAARSALLVLEPEGNWSIKLKELRDEDIRGPYRDEEQSEGRYTPSWIWLTPGANTTSDGDLPEFGEQPKVINGCSDVLVEVFGDRGKHARSAVGMGSLPNQITVEIEIIVEVE